MATNEALLLFLTNLMSLSFTIIYGAGNERRLLNNLLMDYQKYERPVANESLPVSLNFTLSLQQIIDLDERNQLLITNLWLDYTWEDSNLSWNKVCVNHMNVNIYIYIYIYKILRIKSLWITHTII